MTALVIAEHDHGTLKSATLNTVTAAAALGGDVHVLVAGHNAAAAAAAAAQIAGDLTAIADTAAGDTLTALGVGFGHLRHVAGRPLAPRTRW